MGTKKQVEKDFAKRLFIEEKLDRKTIAERLGITEKTVGKWAKDENWEKIRTSLVTIKDAQISLLYGQLEFLNNDIASREYKVATAKEADALIKITNAIKSLEVETNLGDTINVCKKLIQFVRIDNLEFSKNLTRYCDLYIHTLMK